MTPVGWVVWPLAGFGLWVLLTAASLALPWHGPRKILSVPLLLLAWGAVWVRDRLTGGRVMRQFRTGLSAAVAVLLVWLLLLWLAGVLPA